MSRKHRQRLWHVMGEAPPNSPMEEATVGCPWCRGRVVLSYPEGHRCPGEVPRDPCPVPGAPHSNLDESEGRETDAGDKQSPDPPKPRQVFGVGPAAGIGLDIGAAGWRRPGR